MNGTPNTPGPAPDCARTRELLPLRRMGTLAEREGASVDRHLAGCEACAAEAHFLARLEAVRPELPARFTASLLDRIDRERVGATPPVRRARPRFAPRRQLLWGLPAAALFVLALGSGLFWNGGNGTEFGWSSALESPTSTWGDEEWMVAGAPHLGGLSDDVLRVLMEELDP